MLVPRVLEQRVPIAAAPARVLAAFFDPAALACWWQVARSVTTPRALGVYAVEWEPTAASDELLGRLGGTFHGTVIEYRDARELFIADAFWMPPDSEPLGPMGLEVSCQIDGPGTLLRLRQTGFEDSERWRRYHAVIESGWRTSLKMLQLYVEQGPRAVFAERDRQASPPD